MADGTTPDVNADKGTPPPVWTTGLDAELVGHAQNKGWDKMTPDAAAREAVKSHRALELFQGVPAERIVKLPAANADPKEWGPVYERLGAPKEAKDYDFSAIKNKDGTDPDKGFLDAVRKSAFEQRLTKPAAIAFAKDMAAWAEGVETQDNTIDQAAHADEMAKLRESWGKFYDARLIVASQVAAKFGFTAEMVDAMEDHAGYAAVMKAFSDIGSAIGEDNFINPGKAANGAMTKEQAIVRKAEMFSDTAWVGNENTPGTYLGGDPAKNAEFQAVLKIANGG